MADDDRKYGRSGADPVRLSITAAVGAFLLLLIGTGVACAAKLRQETAGPPYDSLAIALSFGLVLAATVAALLYDRCIAGANPPETAVASKGDSGASE